MTNKKRVSFEMSNFNVLTKVPDEVLFSILNKMEKEIQFDEDGKRIYVARYRFKEAGDLTDSENENLIEIEKIFNDLLETKLESFFTSEYLYKKANLFSKYCFKEDSIAEIFLSDNTLTNRLMTGSSYVTLQHSELSNLKSYYSRELYKIFRQFRHLGEVSISKCELYDLLNFHHKSDTYFLKDILEPSLEELREYFYDLSLDNLEKKCSTLPDVFDFSFEKYENVDFDKSFKGKYKEELELLKHIMNS